MTVTAIRTVILYVAVTAAMRLMGKRQIGQLNPAELVVALLIADLAAVPMQDVDLPLLQGLLPIAVLISLEVLLSFAALHSPLLARLLAGSPVCVIRAGKMQLRQMKRLRMSAEDVCEQLRQQGVFDVAEVESAFIESGGQMSLFLRPGARTVCRDDLRGIRPEEKPLLPVLCDGHPVVWGMQACGLTRRQVMAILADEGTRPAQVLLLLADGAGRYQLIRREDTV
ncbi:MAG: DUF421 domain-containing protein [Clostridia bacterium]|nr:DUF421 domain-containing protein [Clostridia bacterium]